MSDFRSDNTDIEEIISRALRSETGVATPQCPSPDLVVDLIEMKDPSAEGRLLLAHIAGCGYCRQLFLTLKKMLQTARMTGGQRRMAPLRADPPARRERYDVLHFDLQRLAAAADRSVAHESQLFCDGAVRATVWVDAQELVLTVERLPISRESVGAYLNLPEAEKPESMDAVLLHYDLFTNLAGWEGFLVAPATVGRAAVEVSFSAHEGETTGELRCRRASITELTDYELVSESIRRTRDHVSRSAWRSFASDRREDLPPGLIETIENVANE